MRMIFNDIYFSRTKKNAAYIGDVSGMEGAIGGLGAKKIPLPGGRSETPGLLLIVNRQALYRFKKKS